jgi:cell division protein FtsB
MVLALDLSRRIRAVVAPCVFLAIAAYFAWSATQGNRGLLAYAERQELFRKVEDDNAAARAELARWERRVAGLRANHLNADTLDERARAMLHLADPTDIVVQYPQSQKLF